MNNQQPQKLRRAILSLIAEKRWLAWIVEILSFWQVLAIGFCEASDPSLAPEKSRGSTSCRAVQPHPLF
jgi:hypothetical protein